MLPQDDLTRELLGKKLEEETSIEKIETLLEQGKKFLIQSDISSIFLHLISKFRHKGLVIFAKLINISPEELTVQSAKDSVIQGQINILRICLHINPSLLNYKYEKGQTLLHFAIIYYQDDIAEFLLKIGADTTAKNDDNQSSLELAKESSYSLYKIMSHSIQQVKLVELDELKKQNIQLQSKITSLEAAITIMKDDNAKSIDNYDKLVKEFNELKSNQQKIIDSKKSPHTFDLKDSLEKSLPSAAEQYLSQKTQIANLSGTLFNSPYSLKPVASSSSAFDFSAQITEVLREVTLSNVSEVNRLLNKNPQLVLAHGDITDLSDRSFKNITALQYAVWAGDWVMWGKIYEYFDSEKAIEISAQQLKEFESRQDIIKEYGLNFDFQLILSIYQEFLNKFSSFDEKERTRYWQQVLGNAQRKCPAWSVYIICEREWSSSKCFERSVDYSKNHLNWWFNKEYRNGVLGKTWAYCCLSASLMEFSLSREKTISGDEGRKLCGSKVHNLFWSPSQNQEHFNTQWIKLWEESVKDDMKAFIHLKAEQTKQLDYFNNLCQEELKKTLRK